MNFKTISNEYRPIPFWSWNERLNVKETKRQIKLMQEVGIGGFIMHARGGLQTEYMGKEWFDNIAVGLNEADQYGMYAWAYDENGWPSGYGNDLINGKGEEYQQKFLRYEPYDGTDKDHTIVIINNIRYYYDVYPAYVDTLDPKVTTAFITEIYEPYYQKFGDRITGFFTDEPEISNSTKGIPWSLTLPEAYRKTYHDDLLLRLPELFQEINDYKQTRIRFWKLVTELFSVGYMKQIYDWCTERGLKLTGHLPYEESYPVSIPCVGACMPHYEYFTIPGIDTLFRRINNDLTVFQIGSAAAQLGKKQVLTESFAMCGHNVSFHELKGIYQYQMVHGVNLLCQHLQGYSMRGIRKRDFPPAMFYQQPWWKEYKIFCDSMSRIGAVLAEGEVLCDTLLINPTTTAWTLYDGKNSPKLEAFYQQIKNLINQLDSKHVPFHLGDEILMERHGRVDGNRIIIGKMSYSRVLLPKDIILFPHTEALLQQFKEAGGVVMVAEEIEGDLSIVDNPHILYTKRKFPEYDIYFFINTTDQEQKAILSVGDSQIDIQTGEEIKFERECCFAPYECRLVIERELPLKHLKAQPQKQKKAMDLSGKWELSSSDFNLLTLDYCDYYFDGELQEANGYVLNIQDRACRLKRPMTIQQKYRVKIKTVPEELYLLCETPQKHKIFVNGTRVYVDENPDWAIDFEFKKLRIDRYIQKGENVITLITHFSQPESVYREYEKACRYDICRNKMTYDMEIEPCYLYGDFGVETLGTFEQLDRGATRFNGEFVLSMKPKELALSEIEKQGFPFFAGSMMLTKEIWVEDSNAVMEFAPKGVNVVSVRVNQKKCATVLWAPYTIDVSPYLKKGKNTIQITLINNLRNMMGPHHLSEGESYIVTPESFYKEHGLWRWGEDDKNWEKGYCLVETSLI
ncbi:MAG: hypothetical protein IKW60_05870 [Clostridia bacterium]|nr:hypothetical protein [Clostridia bacterium]